jgi:hypothetical protein
VGLPGLVIVDTTRLAWFVHLGRVWLQAPLASLAQATRSLPRQASRFGSHQFCSLHACIRNVNDAFEVT